MELTFTNFFNEFFLIHPEDPKLNPEDHKKALYISFAVGILTLGILHGICALVEYALSSRVQPVEETQVDPDTVEKIKETGKRLSTTFEEENLKQDKESKIEEVIEKDKEAIEEKVTEPSKTASPHTVELTSEKIKPSCFFTVGKEQWEKHVGTISEVPKLPSNIDAILAERCPFFEGKSVGETHALVLVTNVVNDQPLEYNHFYDLATPTGLSHDIALLSYPLTVTIEPLISPPRWVLMTKGPIPDSQNKSYEEQIELASNHPGYRIPKALEVVILFSMHHIMEEQLLYPAQTFTRCEDVFEANWSGEGPFDPNEPGTTDTICVGRLRRGGLEIQPYSKEPDRDIGLALCRDLT